MEEIVKMEDVWVSYGLVPVLEAVSLTIGPGDFLGLIGPNGGGKTTLLKVMMGLVKPNRGKVIVLGKSPEQSRGEVGYVPQKPLFDPTFPISAWEVVLMGRFARAGLVRRYSSEDKALAREALETVGMAEYRDRQIGQLSGGQQQRVFIARALATHPKLLLLDEPMESIDPATQAEFYELLQGLTARISIVMVSHNISAVSVYVKQIGCLNRQLFYHGTKEISPEVLQQTYKCPIELIAHGEVPHRILKEHP